jgi:amino acid adenylation domain-containing protein
MQGLGVSSESLVALVMERSITMVVAIYGVLKSGAAYVPIDPQSPDSRKIELLSGMQPQLVLVQSATSRSIPAAFVGPVSRVENDGSLHTTQPKALTSNRPSDSALCTPASLAYVLFTSGSTGQPKGVMVEHRAITSILAWLRKEFAMGPGDKILFKTPFTWSVSRWELFWPLTCGATLVVLPDSAHKLPRSLHDALEHHNITHAFFSPTQLRLLIEHCSAVAPDSDATSCPRLKHMICVGEPLEPELCRKFQSVFHTARLANQMGPTEAGYTQWVCPPKNSLEMLSLTCVPIGKPTSSPVYVVDGDLKATAVGMIGELCFGGASVARGYLNMPELTKERFIPDPFAHDGASKMYKTGDLAYWSQDGELHFVGRLDRQVKIRGQRVELAEVEVAAKRLPLVDRAVAVATRSEPRNLVLYVVPTREVALKKAALTAGETAQQDISVQVSGHIAATLPAYMKPAAVLCVSEFPTLSNGKVDYLTLESKALETLEMDACDRSFDRTPMPSAMLAAASSPEELAEMGMDSLGMIRALTQAYRDEEALGNNLRAIFSLGVMIDRFNACQSYGPPQIPTYMTICNELIGADVPAKFSQFGTPYWLEKATTLIGGTKSIAGFAMVTAYFDARHNKNGLSFDRRDVALLIVYLEMVWVIPAIAGWVSLPLFGIPMPASASVHRWYILALLYCRIVLVSFNRIGVPPLAQVIVTMLASFLSRGHWVGCIAVYCGAPSAIDWFGRLLLRGCWHDDDCISTSPYSGQNWLMTDGKFALIAVYIFSFHYLPALMQALSGAALRLSQLGKWSLVCCKIVAFLLLGAICAGAFSRWVGLEDSFLTYEEMPWSQVWRPHFWGKWVLVMLTTMAPCILLGIVLAGTSVHFKTAGSNSLGTYIIHPYFKPLIPYHTLIFLSGKWIGCVGQLLIILGLPMLFQFVVGPLFQQVMVMHLKWGGIAVKWAFQSLFAGVRNLAKDHAG